MEAGKLNNVHAESLRGRALNKKSPALLGLISTRSSVSFALVLLFFVFYLGLPSILRAQFYTAADSVAIYSLLDQADEAKLTDEALDKANEALQLSISKKMQRGEAFALLKIAYLMIEEDPKAEVSELFEKADKIGIRLNDGFILALSLVEQGKQALYTAQYQRAQQLFSKALDDYFHDHPSEFTAIVYNDLGMAAGKLGNRTLETEYYLKAMLFHEKLNDWNGWANSAGNLANAFFYLNDYEQAVSYAKAALRIHENNKHYAKLATIAGNITTMYSRMGRVDSALHYQDKALGWATINGHKKNIIQVYQNKALLLDRTGDYEGALTAMEEAIKMSKAIDDFSGTASKYRSAAIFAGKLGDTTLMNRYYDLSFSIADSLGAREIVRDIYGSKAAYYSKKNDFYRAYNFLKRFHTLRDSLAEEATRNQIAELHTRFESERKDLEIERLRTAEKIRTLEFEKQRAIIAGNYLETKQKENAILLLKQQQLLREAQITSQNVKIEQISLEAQEQKLRLQLSQQQNEIESQRSVLMLREIQRQKWVRNGIVFLFVAAVFIAFLMFNRYQIKKQLDEKNALIAIREKISRDLHDEIGSSITNINVLNELARRNVNHEPGTALLYLSQTGSHIQNISDNLSDIVWSLQPAHDDTSQLIGRMKRYAADMLAGSNIQYNVDISDSLRDTAMHMQMRHDFYLVFKEAINNIVKHSGATRVNINIKNTAMSIEMEISDNGNGGSVSHTAGGNGLKNMKHRVEQHGGTFRINQSPESGTCLNFIFPLKGSLHITHSGTHLKRKI